MNKSKLLNIIPMLFAFAISGCSKSTTPVTPSKTNTPSPTPSVRPTPSVEPTPSASIAPTTHTHNFSKSWSYDEEFHWHKCDGCEEIIDKEEHTFTDTVHEPTQTEEGYTHHECFCGYIYDDNYVPKLLSPEDKAKADLGVLPVFSADQKTFTYGFYPQEYVSDEKLISQLDKLTNIQFVGSNFTTYDRELRNYNVYKYENNYYCKDTANFGAIKSNYEYLNDGTKISKNSVGWFKFAPIEWIVLENENNLVKAVSSKVLDSSIFSDSNSMHAPYYESTLQKYLNEDFYHDAFKYWEALTKEESYLSTMQTPYEEDDYFKEMVSALSSDEYVEYSKEGPFKEMYSDYYIPYADFAAFRGCHVAQMGGSNVNYRSAKPLTRDNDGVSMYFRTSMTYSTSNKETGMGIQPLITLNIENL